MISRSTSSAVAIVPRVAHHSRQRQQNFQVAARSRLAHGFLDVCTCPQVLVTVPVFSAKLVAGNTTSAASLVSVGKSSATVRKASLPRCCLTSGNVFAGFDPNTSSALISPDLNALQNRANIAARSIAEILACHADSIVAARGGIGNRAVAGKRIGQQAHVGRAAGIRVIAERDELCFARKRESPIDQVGNVLAANFIAENDDRVGFLFQSCSCSAASSARS